MVIERVVTVEYLEPSMSRDLLIKFPDNSAFDFDYEQSGIWSPLVPRTSLSLSALSAGKRKKFPYGSEKILKDNLGKLNKKFQKAVRSKKKMGKKKSFVFPATPVQGASAPVKGWSKVLKAASKHFKKHKGSSLQLKLPSK
ncbi:hypothetical protein MRB53_018666 [Persea americana]|uniref:Uncharacterized protein n=1 Tax=Persea americana TaxID=3435 RepID=A0ACC2M9Z1_PERAE|nr:hypothetical protein MRB53_018666 [Persea americana]